MTGQPPMDPHDQVQDDRAGLEPSPGHVSMVRRTSVESDGTGGADRRTRSKRPGARRWIPVLFVLLGILVLVYPVAATQYNNIKQREFAQTYNSQINEISTEDRSAQLARARAYNDTITGVPILDPYLDTVRRPQSEAYENYSSQLAATQIMARLRVPSAAVDLPVRHGTTSDVIGAGVGHLYGTSLPVGGVGTHAVLTSHTGMSSATLFDHLIDVREGDLFFIDVSGETLAYRVDQIKVVLPEEIGDLVPVPGHDYVTLFTCTPYAVNSHRLLVRGERVDWNESVAAQYEEPVSSWWAWLSSLETWMWGLLAGALMGVVGLLAIIRRDHRRRHGSVSGRDSRMRTPGGQSDGP